MRCIFCCQNSERSRSCEHIVPESLGNTKNVLPPGIVCDTCNNYFAVKVEGPLLSSGFFRHLRFRQMVPSKKGRVPVVEDLLSGDGIPLGMAANHRTGMRHLYPLDDADGTRLIESVFTSDPFWIVGPIPVPPEHYLFGRFLAKVGLEVLTQRAMLAPGWEEAVVFRKELDEVRNFARYGKGPRVWPYHERRIYDEDCKFIPRGGGPPEQVIYEFTPLYTPTQELYAIIAIFGVEYTINLGGPEIDGYERWLVENNYISPLYPFGFPGPEWKEQPQ
jgi:hypothetical protein